MLTVEASPAVEATMAEIGTDCEGRLSWEAQLGCGGWLQRGSVLGAKVGSGGRSGLVMQADYDGDQHWLPRSVWPKGRPLRRSVGRLGK